MLFLVVMVVKCPGCKKMFETNGSLSSHRQSCMMQVNTFMKQILDQQQALEEPLTKHPRFGKNRVIVEKGKEPETPIIEELESVQRYGCQ